MQKDGNTRGSFQSVNDFQLNNSVIFTDYVKYSDLPAIYSGAKVFVYPLLFYEGFGFPPLEAMSCGCPVITSNSSSLPEVVDTAGITVDPLNHHELKESILEVINDENLGNSLRRKRSCTSRIFLMEKMCSAEQRRYIPLFR